METVILAVHVIAALSVIGLVLLQHGKGADAGAAFGGGSAGGVFGSAGASNFLSRTTAILAVVFFLTSLSLTVLSARRTDSQGVMSKPAPVKSAPSDVPVPSTPMGQTVPAAPAAPAIPVTAPAAPAAPAGDGLKAGDVPK